MTDTSASGSGAAFAADAKTHSRFCLTGWFPWDITVSVVVNRRVNGLQSATLRSRQRRTAKIRRAYPIHLPSAGGYRDACSACGFG
jgi:hypothetical protein